MLYPRKINFPHVMYMVYLVSKPVLLYHYFKKCEKFDKSYVQIVFSIFNFFNESASCSQSKWSYI